MCYLVQRLSYFFFMSKFEVLEVYIFILTSGSPADSDSPDENSDPLPPKRSVGQGLFDRSAAVSQSCTSVL